MAFCFFYVLFNSTNFKIFILTNTLRFTYIMLNLYLECFKCDMQMAQQKRLNTFYV